MSSKEIAKVVNRYIGVSDGYLGDFSYASHRSFYPEYCDLDVDPDQYEGTTRERFIQVLSNSSPAEQAKIIRGVIERFPVAESSVKTRTQEVQASLLKLADELENDLVRHEPISTSQSEVVRKAIADADVLLKSTGSVNAVDRVHTAIFGYMIELCEEQGIEVDRKNTSMTSLLKKLRQNHPALTDESNNKTSTSQILNGCAQILDAFNPQRNNGSIAHPNADLLSEDEARLNIDVARSLMSYFERKLSSSKTPSKF